MKRPTLRELQDPYLPIYELKMIRALIKARRALAPFAYIGRVIAPLKSVHENLVATAIQERWPHTYAAAREPMGLP